VNAGGDDHNDDDKDDRERDPSCERPDRLLALVQVVGGVVVGGGVVLGVVFGTVVRGVVVRGEVVGGSVDGGAVLGGSVEGVVGASVGGLVDSTVDVDDDVVVDVTVGTSLGLLDEPPVSANAITTAATMTTNTGIAIQAHVGRPEVFSGGGGEAGPRGAADAGGTADITRVSSSRERIATASVGSASSGGYHLPSSANHQPGSSGGSSAGPRGVSLISVTRLRRCSVRREDDAT
jgi:hypothetical protein